MEFSWLEAQNEVYKIMIGMAYGCQLALLLNTFNEPDSKEVAKLDIELLFRENVQSFPKSKISERKSAVVYFRV